MKADTPLVAEVHASPNHDERARVVGPDMLILHYTGMLSAEAAIERLCDPHARVSSHYLVDEDGRIVQLVPEVRRAWHAGRSFWKGGTDITSRSIGIEVVNPGHEHGYVPFPPRQVAAVIELCRHCVSAWPIGPHFVLAHSDIAPDRKQDPGELFPWDQLSSAGIGVFVPPTPIGGGRFLSLGDSGTPVAAYQGLLAAYGYQVEMTGVFDDTTRLATIAFQRHHRQARVDGIADGSTIDTLHRVAKAAAVAAEGPANA